MKNLFCYTAALLTLSVVPCFAEQPAVDPNAALDAGSVEKETAAVPAAETVKTPEEAEPEFVAEEPNAVQPDAIPAPAVENENIPEAKKAEYKRCVKISYVVITSKDETACFLASEIMKAGDALVIVVPDSETQVESSTELEVRLPDGNTFPLTTARLSRFLAFLRPKNVILLGSDAVLPKIFSLAVPSYCTKLTVNDISWKVNAIKLDDILNTGHRIYGRYQEFFNKEMTQALDNAKNQEHELVPGQEPAETTSGSVTETEAPADNVEFKENKDDQVPGDVPVLDKK